MSTTGLHRAVDKMRSAGVPELAIEVFGHYYAQLEQGRTGLIPEDSIEPVLDVTDISQEDVSPEQQRAALSQTVMIKLNGGLGTTMGMDRAKSLLEVREGLSFFDIIARQLVHARQTAGVALPLLLMDSFRTHDDTLAALAAYPGIAVDDLPLDFLQHQEPKLLVDTLEPVEWPADPALEWCPPGHGDIYVALQTTGLLDELIARGYRHANTSNADNLGAAPDGRIAGWFAASGARTPRSCADGRRRTARAATWAGGGPTGGSSCATPRRRPSRTCAGSPTRSGTRTPTPTTCGSTLSRCALRDALAARDGIPGLPLIRNRKHVDPTDKDSPEVYQIECALGAVVELFEDPAPVLVERSRFLPVKTTDDLLLLRSDAYDLGADHRLRLVPEKACLVTLDPHHYRRIADFEARFPSGAPSLKGAERLDVAGDWTFGAGVVVTGDVRLADPGRPVTVPDGADLADVATADQEEKDQS